MRDLFMRFALLSGTGGLVVLALHFAKPLLRRVPAKQFVWLWLLLALRMLVPLGFAPPMPAVETPLLQSTVMQMPTPAIATPAPATRIAAAPAQTPTDWFGIAMIAWGVGAAVFFAWHIAVYLHTKQKLLRGTNITDSALLRELCDEYALRQPRLLKSPAAQTPLAFGLLRPVIVLPARQFSELEFECVLRHELCHLKARHLPMKLLLLAVNALHWCNPAAWLLRHNAAAAMEQCCDEMALCGATNERRGVYSQTLLACAGRQRFAPALTSNLNGGTKEMKARLRNIFTAKPKRTIAISVVVLLCAALAVTAAGIGPGLVAGKAKAQPNPGEAREPQTMPAEYNVFHQEQIAQTMPNVDYAPAPTQLLWPAPDVIAITRGYGRVEDNFHDGIDIADETAKGKAVVAAADGYVEGTGSGGTNGVYIVLNHGGGMWTAYEHLEEGSVMLQFGEKVHAGQPIARIGSTGQSTGPHLHFEVLQNNAAVDPMPYLMQP